MKGTTIKNIFASILVLAAIMLFCGCRECLPVGTAKYTPDEREALRIVKEMRAALAELVAQGADVSTPARLCRKLVELRDAYHHPRLIELVDALPAAWFNDPQALPGVYGAYRFVLVTGMKQGVYAIPHPASVSARTVFYAGLPGGLYVRKAEGFPAADPVTPPDPDKDREWRPIPVLK